MKAEKTQKEVPLRAIQREPSRGRVYMEDNRPGAVGQAKMIEISQFKDFPLQLKSFIFNEGKTIQRVRILDSNTLAKSLGEGEIGYQAHHIIPNEVVVEAYNRLVHDSKIPTLTEVISTFDQAWNGIYLPTFSTKYLPSHEGSHPEYDRAIYIYILETQRDITSIIKDINIAKDIASHFKEIITSHYPKEKSISKVENFYIDKGRSLTTEEEAKMSLSRMGLSSPHHPLMNPALNISFYERGYRDVHSLPIPSTLSTSSSSVGMDVE